MATSVRVMADQELSRAMIAASKGAAEKVVPYAKALVPVSSGALSRTIKTAATRSRASIKAGTAKKVPYALPIHRGRYFPSTGTRTRASKFISKAIPKAYPEIREEYVAAMNRIAKKFYRKHGAHQVRGRYGSKGRP
jgi:hypothetical protein